MQGSITPTHIITHLALQFQKENNAAESQNIIVSVAEAVSHHTFSLLHIFGDEEEEDENAY